MKPICALWYAKKIFFSRAKSAGDSKESSHGRRSIAGAIATIALSLVPLVAVISVGNGMYRGITGRLIALNSQDIQVSVDRKSPYAKNYRQLVEASEKLGEVYGVKKAWPEFRGMALAVGALAQGERVGAFVRGVVPEFMESTGFTSYFDVTEGSAVLEGIQDAVLGQKIAELLGVHPGDRVNLISVVLKGNSLVPRVKVFTVRGIVSSGYQEMDALWFFVSAESALNAVSRDSFTCVIGLETLNPYLRKLQDVMARVSQQVYEDDDFENSYCLDWMDANMDKLENLESTKALLVVVMILIIIVAAVNISSAVLMTGLERRKEVAVLKSTGATDGGICLAFTAVGAFASVAGILLGLPFGIIISVFANPLIKGIEHVVNFFTWGNKIMLLDPAYYLQKIPVYIPWGELGLIAALTLVLSVIMALIPAISISRKNISESLKK